MDKIRKQDMIKFRTIEDITEENILKSEKELLRLQQQARDTIKKEQVVPNFSSNQEAQIYFGDTPFEEWERKMKEKYGI